MKSRFFNLIVLPGFLILATPLPLFAQQTTISDEHIDRIKSNCQSALGTLSRIHANDAPTYVNRNQTYFSISDKMMARLNGRLAFNRFDASQLVRTASNFDTMLADFRSAYRQYDTAMAELVRMDCRKQPVSFYQKVGEVRQLRQKVNDASDQLKSLIDQYRSEVIIFQMDNATQLKVGR